MKTLFLMSVLVFGVACGKGGGSSAATSKPSIPGVTANTYSLRITGDNLQFSRSSIISNSGLPSEFQYVSEGPVTIPPGTQYVLDMTGLTLSNISVSRLAGAGANLIITVYKNSLAVETFTLTTNGTFNNFQNQ